MKANEQGESGDGRQHEVNVDFGGSLSAFRETVMSVARTVARAQRDFLRRNAEVAEGARKLVSEAGSQQLEIARAARRVFSSAPFRSLAEGAEDATRVQAAIVEDAAEAWKEVAERVVRPALEENERIAAAMYGSPAEIARTLEALSSALSPAMDGALIVQDALGALGAEIGPDPAAIRRMLRAVTSPSESPAEDEDGLRWVAGRIGPEGQRAGLSFGTIVGIIGIVVGVAGIVHSEMTTRRHEKDHRQLKRDHHRLREEHVGLGAGQDSIMAALRRRCGPREGDSASPDEAQLYAVLELTPIRSAPASDATVVETIYPNQPVTVLKRAGSWLRVRFVDHVRGETYAGWVRGRNVTRARWD